MEEIMRKIKDPKVGTALPSLEGERNNRTCSMFCQG